MNTSAEEASAGTSPADKASAGKAFAPFLPTLLLPTLLLPTLYPQTALATTYDLREQTPAVKAALDGRHARYAQLNAAQAKGWAGEGNQGLAVKLGGGPEIDALIAAENQDRMVIYHAIVEQNHLPPEALATVQQVFAETQRDRADPGDPIQLPSGEWTRK